MALAQEERPGRDSLQYQADTFRLDTSYYTPVSEDAIPSTINYTAQDSTPMYLEEQMVYLYNKAVVTYEDIVLRADYMSVDLEKQQVFAKGAPDSTGTIAGKPVFKQGSEEFKCDELTYNFNTRKGIMRNIVTEQEGGVLRSEVTKRQADGQLHNSMSKYTTCDAEHPHFYVGLTKAKVIPNEKIISGPAYLVVADIPLPLVLPFGYFPQQDTRASGLIIPTYGEERNRGFYLRDGGYYFAMNEYFDLSVRGSAYTNGTWMANASSSYKVRYRFSGELGFEYASNVSGRKGIDYSKAYNYRIRWSHRQDAKASPGTRFSASVNMSSSGFDRENEYDLNQYVTNTKQSSISFAKNWTGTPFNLTASLNHSQNTRNQTVSLNLPKVSFSVQRLYPFKRKISTGGKRWYEDIQIQYTANMDNRINTLDSLLFTPEVFSDMNSGFQHRIPVSTILRPFNNFTITPSATYTGVLYTQSVRKNWVENYVDPESGETVSALLVDTLSGPQYGHALMPRISASFSPKIFGFFEFGPKSKIEAIRHVIMPNATFSYVPSVESLSSKMYYETRVNENGDTQEYSIFEGRIYGTPSLGRESGSVSLSVNNILEGKIREEDDTTNTSRKISLIESLNFNTNYNVFADSMAWSPVNFRGATKLFNNKVRINFRGTFDPYGVVEDSLGVRKVKEAALQVNDKLARLTSFTFGFSTSLKSKASSSSGGGQSASRGMGGSMEGAGAPGSGLDYDEFGYARYKGTWSVNLNYNLSYRKAYFEPDVTQTLRFSGSFNPTSKWGVNFSSGVDLETGKLTPSRLTFYRDLHCWEMNMSWSPIGRRQFWMFTLRAKAQILQDLKYEKKKDFHDTSNRF